MTPSTDTPSTAVQAEYMAANNIRAKTKRRSVVYDTSRPMTPKTGRFRIDAVNAARRGGFVLRQDLAESIVDAVFSRLRAELVTGNSVALPGVGCLRVVVRERAGCPKRLSVVLRTSDGFKQDLHLVKP